MPAGVGMPCRSARATRGKGGGGVRLQSRARWWGPGGARHPRPLLPNRDRSRDASAGPSGSMRIARGACGRASRGVGSRGARAKKGDDGACSHAIRGRREWW